MVRVIRVVFCALAMLACSVSAAPAAGPPTAFTGSAAQLTTSSAVLKGSVYPSDEPTGYYFQYGPTSAYGSQTAQAALPAGKQSVHVTAALTGLQAGATYHFRLVAVNATATVLGSDMTFKTQAVPLVLQLAPMPRLVTYEQPFTASGYLTGTGSAGRSVVLEEDRAPLLSGFAPLGPPVTVSSDGSFSLTAPGLVTSGAMRVATVGLPVAHSAVVAVRVAVRVVLHVARGAHRGHPRLYGSVWPAQNGAVVRIQLVRDGHAVETLARTRLVPGRDGRSRFSVTSGRRVRAGLYRALAGSRTPALFPGHSRAVLVR